MHVTKTLVKYELYCKFQCSYVQKSFNDMSNPKCICTKIENLSNFELKHLGNACWCKLWTTVRDSICSLNRYISSILAKANNSLEENIVLIIYKFDVHSSSNCLIHIILNRNLFK